MFLSIRNLFVVVGALVLSFLVVLPASADPGCTGGVINAMFNPGLRIPNPAQTITADSTGSSLTCTGWGAGAYPAGIHVDTNSSADMLLCVSLKLSGTVMTIRWSDGTLGTATLASSDPLELLLTLRAKMVITAGNYAGSNLSFTGNVSPGEFAKLGSCLVTPVTSLSASFSLTKTP